MLRKIRAGEGHPGVLGHIRGTEFHLFGVHRERSLHGRPGELIASRNGAICRATVDGSVWITHLKRGETPEEKSFKLPATHALSLAGAQVNVPEVAAAINEGLSPDHTYREIRYEEHGAVGYLHFDFYNGAYRNEEPARSHACFFGADSSYHEARRRFFYKITIARSEIQPERSRVTPAARAA